jgi:chromosome segregation ATPase
MEQQKRPWWLAVVTIPNVIAVGGLLLGGAMTYQAQLQRVDAAEDRIVRAEKRIDALESRLDKTVSDIAAVYMRRDNVTVELTAIREQIQLLRRDLR